MSRPFALDGHEMQVIINGDEQLHRFDIECEFKFPRDGVPSNDITVADDDWAEELVLYEGSGRPSAGGSDTPRSPLPRMSSKGSPSSPTARWPSGRSSSSAQAN